MTSRNLKSILKSQSGIFVQSLYIPINFSNTSKKMSGLLRTLSTFVVVCVTKGGLRVVKDHRSYCLLVFFRFSVNWSLLLNCHLESSYFFFILVWESIYTRRFLYKPFYDFYFLYSIGVNIKRYCKQVLEETTII